MVRYRPAGGFVITDLAIKALFVVSGLALAFGGLQWYVHTQREAGRAEVIATAQKAASAAQAANAAITSARDDLAAAALFRHAERLKTLEAQDAQDHASRDADRALIVRLRNSTVASRRETTDDAGSTCAAGHLERDSRLDQLQAEGQRLVVEAGELAATSRELVSEAAAGMERNAAVIDLARDWAAAVKLGER